jgi:hypothetical protein
LKQRELHPIFLLGAAGRWLPARDKPGRRRVYSAEQETTALTETHRQAMRTT